MPLNRSRSLSFAVTGAVANFLGPNFQRIGLWFFPPTVGRYSIGFGEDAVLDRGHTMRTTDTSPIYVSYTNIGQDVNQRVSLVSDVATTVPVVEIVQRPEE
jgi:hypothetical protein